MCICVCLCQCVSVGVNVCVCTYLCEHGENIGGLTPVINMGYGVQGLPTVGNGKKGGNKLRQ